MFTRTLPKNGGHGSSVIAQIIFAFATLAGIIIFFAVSVFFAFNRIEHNIRILAVNSVPILDNIGTVQENMGLIQISILRHMLATDRNEKRQEEQLIATAYAANSALLQRKEGLVLSPEEEKMYASVLTSRKTYTEFWQKLLSMSSAGSSKEAVSFNQNNLRPAYDEYQKVLNTISAYIKSETKKRVSRVSDFMEAVQRICTVLFIAGLFIAAVMGLVIVRVTKKLRENNRVLEAEIFQRKKAEQHQDVLILELKDALDNIKQLSGLLPICASCKKIRDDQGYWQRIETYISEHSKAQFTHGICPDCSKKLYPAAHKNDTPEKS